MPDETHPTEAESKRSPFAEGDVAILYDRRRRRYRVELKHGGSFSTHMGAIPHDEIIGRHEGFGAVTHKGHRLLVFRPTFRENVLELPRQSQVIYPKDIGQILMHGDIYPGACVVELGLGSGAMSAALLRAIGPTGSLTTYEVREGILEAAARNVARLAGEKTEHKLVIGDVYESGIAERDVDRILTDVPEPWQIANSAADALRTGGILIAYLPTVLQVHHLTVDLTQDSRWRLVNTVELMEREWHIADNSARPGHRMIGHTGFITTARRTQPLPDLERDVPPGDDQGDDPHEGMPE
jgi:tRNA (adenine57-N1/adenine58-N1)-methyltransferase